MSRAEEKWTNKVNIAATLAGIVFGLIGCLLSILSFMDARQANTVSETAKTIASSSQSATGAALLSDDQKVFNELLVERLNDLSDRLNAPKFDPRIQKCLDLAATLPRAGGKTKDGVVLSLKGLGCDQI